jgi:hypothetical protein
MRQPGFGPEQMKTYQVASPITSHRRRADCDDMEVNCAAHRNGWITVVDESTDLGRRQAAYIRQECRPTTAELAVSAGVRRYIESRTPAGWTEFRFPAGQLCFAQHTARLHRPDIFIVRDGDTRGNPRGTDPYIHTEGEHWVEDHAEHHDRIRKIVERG